MKPQPAPVTTTRILDRQRTGRLIVLPSSSATTTSAPTNVVPLPTPREVHAEAPARKPRKRPVRRAEPVAAAPTPPPEPIPARQWVVVRRPARVAPEGSAPLNGNASAAAEQAPPPPSTPPESAVQPVSNGDLI
ncbi:Hypothetical protein A7982_04142 [Minicystis rosea]|nr:Hypothetical protein A7982_04142 [Minicystis rosea]